MTAADIPELDWMYEAKRDLLRSLPILVPITLLALWLAS